MSIDPRLIARRREVAEDRAKRTVRRLLSLLVLLAAGGALVWLAFSPFLSVAMVQVVGVESSDANRILTENGVRAGSPMVLVRTGAAESALEEDPWVEHAEVELDWPDRVVARVSERVPVAWVLTGGGWSRRAIDGQAVPSPDEPDDLLPHVELGSVNEADASTSPLVLAALEFTSAYEGPVEVFLEDGRLWASAGGLRALLGRPIEMSDKAAALEALVEEPLPDGSTVNITAPSNPAVVLPSAVPGEGEDGEEK